MNRRVLKTLLTFVKLILANLEVETSIVNCIPMGTIRLIYVIMTRQLETIIPTSVFNIRFAFRTLTAISENASESFERVTKDS